MWLRLCLINNQPTRSIQLDQLGFNIKALDEPEDETNWDKTAANSVLCKLSTEIMHKVYHRHQTSVNEF